MIQIVGDHRDFDDGTELEQMLLNQMLPGFTAAKVEDE